MPKMGGAGRIGLLSLLILTAAVYFVITKAYGGDRKAMVEGFRYSAERLGPWAMPVFVLVHTVAIALCFPYAIVFEAAASFLFGFLNGVMCVFAAKVMGASLAFWLGRALFRSSTWASDLVRKNKYFDIINKGVVRDGWKFVLLARFSPVPSYVINYGLAATNVSFPVHYLLPTIAGGLPMIIQNTSIGSLTSAATMEAGADKTTASKSGVLTYILPAIGIVSSILITWRIRKYAKYASSEDFVLIDASLTSSKDPCEREQDGQQQLDTRMPSSDESSEYSQTLHRRSTSQSPSMSQHS